MQGITEKSARVGTVKMLIFKDWLGKDYPMKKAEREVGIGRRG